jgi:hypothetical protein
VVFFHLFIKRLFLYPVDLRKGLECWRGRLYNYPVNIGKNGLWAKFLVSIYKLYADAFIYLLSNNYEDFEDENFWFIQSASFYDFANISPLLEDVFTDYYNKRMDFILVCYFCYFF